MYDEDTSNWSAFIAGAFIGAGVALLLAPQSGSELRSSLRDYASRAKDELEGAMEGATEQGRAVWDSAMERGQEYMERGQEYVEGGKQAIRKAGRAAREFVDESAQTAEKAAGEATSRRG